MSFNAEINSIYKRNNHSEKKGKTYNMISDIKLYIIIKLILKSTNPNHLICLNDNTNKSATPL